MLENQLSQPGLVPEQIKILKASIPAQKKHCDCILENISNSDAKAMLEGRATSGLTKAALECQKYVDEIFE